MFEPLNNYLDIIILYFPLGFIGIWRWSVWLFKKIVAFNYKPIKNNGYSSTLSVVTPVYNEDPNIFYKALESWKQNKPDEIIAVIDYSDKACIKKFREFSKGFKNAKLIVTKKPGKRPALSDGVKASKSKIIALIDSDTVWDKNIKSEMLAPFLDPLVGGVGTRQDVLKKDTLAKRLFNIHLDQRYFDEMTYLARAGNVLTCLSGRTALYRREAIIHLVDKMVNETFLGKRCISGEDKCLTRLVQADRWKVRFQRDICVRTTGAPDILTFLKQQTRWIRNSWRSDLKSLFSRWIWREKFLAYHLIDRYIQPITLLLGPIYLFLSIIWGHWIMVIVLIIWWHISRAIKIYPHLKRKPSDFLILPYYILMIYVMAVIKIYAFFTMNKQGWITRWDKDRLVKLKFLRLVPYYLGTAMIIFSLSFGVINYKETVAVANINNNTNFSYVKGEKDINTNKHKQNILGEFENVQFGYYTMKEGDSLSEINNRYNLISTPIYNINKERITDPDYNNVGEQILIPVSGLKNTLEKDKLYSTKEPDIVFKEIDNTIRVRGGGSVVTLSKINSVMNNKNILEQYDNKEWVLRSNLYIENNVTFIIDDSEVSWLKLKSDRSGFVWLKSYNGNILIKNTKITSWDESIQAPDTELEEDGRSFVLAKYSGRMDVLNSEIAYLGSRGLDSLGGPFGGSYGISWKLANNTFKEDLISGNILNSKFHHNYFGVYTYGATGMIIKENEFYENIQYGLDPHDDSNNLIIENNKAYDNGNHGIILSKRCFNNIIRNNTSHNNRLHGIMLDRNSNNNLVEDNFIYNNTDGIAFYNSSNNLIRNNKIKDNKNGIRANVNSQGNYFEQNKITANKYGIYLYDQANSNYIIDNIIKENTVGIYLKDAFDNIIKDSFKKGDNKKNIKSENNAENNSN